MLFFLRVGAQAPSPANCHRMILQAGMAELADAADLKSAGLKKLVGVRVPLSAPDPHSERSQESLLLRWLVGEVFLGILQLRCASLRISPAGSRFAHARKT